MEHRYLIVITAVHEGSILLITDDHPHIPNVPQRDACIRDMFSDGEVKEEALRNFYYEGASGFTHPSKRGNFSPQR
jgi:hypothetical protein